MKERVITFGEEKNLVGILTEPDSDHKAIDMPCVLMLNAGILHHVGPFRLHVAVARNLAAKGIVTFRLDVGGIGDSLLVRGAGYDADRVVSDIKMAMDELNHKKGINDFVLMGLCTGAANAHRVAMVDDRVSGGIFLDGYAYPGWRFYIRRYLPAILDPIRGKDWLVRLTRRVTGRNHETDVDSDMVEDFGWWILPPKNEVQKDLTKLVDRNVNLLYVFSGGQSEFYNYKEQFVHAFPAIDFKGKLRVIYNNEADHTYSMGLDRDRLISQVAGWLNESYRS